MGCGGDDDETAAEDLTPVTLQSKWVVQAQFAGYYAAEDQGYYEDEGLDVTIRPGGPDIVPEQVVAGGQAEFGINWLDSLLATRDQGQDLVNIAQVFTRSGMTEITWADSGLDDITKLEGKKVGVWLGGNEHKLFAALTKNGIDPQKDADIVAQPFDMNLFLNREVDAAAAMTYNELAQVLEVENPDTGELYTEEELNVFKMSDLGTGAMEDGVFVRGDWIADEANQDIAKRPEGELPRLDVLPGQPGRLRPDRARQRPHAGRGAPGVADERDQRSHLAGALGIGVMDPASFELTNQIASDYGIIKTPATSDAYRTDIAEAALAELEDDDTTGEDWEKPEVEVTPGGE